MSKVLIIGAGGVGRVVAHKCAQASDVFTGITLASRTESKCKAIAAEIGYPVKTARVDADNVPELTELIKREQPRLVINVALPYQDLTIMDACLATESTTLIPPTMSRGIPQNSNTAGSGHIRTVSATKDSWHSWAAVSTPV